MICLILPLLAILRVQFWRKGKGTGGKLKIVYLLFSDQSPTNRMAMQLIEVTTPEQAKDFIQVNVDLNRKVPGYIRPIDKEINEVFDKEQNKAFRFGEVIRWIL